MGEVPQSFTDLVVELVSSYSRVLEVDFLEVLVYPDEGRALEVLTADAELAGSSVVALYPVLHDAWFNYPRVHVVYSTCRSLSREELETLLAHEVAHAKLHGKREYYRVVLDPQLVGTLGSQRYLEHLHAVSTVLKDLQVFKLLESRGLTRELLNYARYCLRQLSSVGSYLEVLKLLAPAYYLEKYLGLALTSDPRVRALSTCLEVLLETATEVPYVDVGAPIALRKLIELNCTEYRPGG